MKTTKVEWSRPVVTFKKLSGSRRKRKKERQRLLKKLQNHYIFTMSCEVEE